MPKLSDSTFFTALRKSGVVDSQRLSQLESNFAADADPKKVAMGLVRDGVLTRWQAQFLLTGRDNLVVGKYVLLERLSQDESGDRFRAKHQQLERPVELFILPAAMSEHPETLRRFLDQATTAARLDHPGMIHVYDVDHQADRYYIVAEHFEAQSLRHLIDSRRKSELFPIAQAARQLIVGIKYLVENGVKHGKIDIDCILLDSNGVAKISILAEGFQFSAASNDNGDLAIESTHEDDIVRLGRSLLMFFDTCATDIDDVQRQRLRIILDQLTRIRTIESELPLVEQNLDKWLQRNRLDNADSVLVQKRTQENTSGKSFAGWETVSNGWGQLGLAYRIGLPIVAVALLAIVVGLLFWNRGSSDRAATDDVTATAEDTNSHSETSPKKSRSRSDKNSSEDESTEREVADDGDADGSSMNEDALGGIDIAEDLDEGPPIDADDPEAVADPPSTEIVANDDGEDPVSDAAADVAANSDPLTEPTVNTTTPQPTKDEKLPPPFVAMPLAAELPDVAQAKLPMTIGVVYTGPRDLLGTTLVCDENFTRRIAFTIERATGEHSQRWHIMAPGVGGQAPTNIADIWLAETELKFEWTESAAANIDNNYLRNCLLRLDCRSEFHYLPLRAPAIMGPLVITEEAPQAKVEFDLDWIPDRKQVTVELVGIGDGHPAEGGDGFLFTIEPLDYIVPERGALTAFLTQKDDRYMRVDIEARIARRSTCTADFLIVQNPKPKPFSEKLYLEVEAELQRQANEVSTYLQRLEAYEPVYGEKTKHADEVKRVKKLLEAAAMRLADLTEQYERRSHLYGQPIKLRVHMTIAEIPVDLATWDGEVTVAETAESTQ